MLIFGVRGDEGWRVRSRPRNQLFDYCLELNPRCQNSQFKVSSRRTQNKGRKPLRSPRAATYHHRPLRAPQHPYQRES